MTDATVAANARSLPEATINPDAELISDVAQLRKHADVMMVLREPQKMLYDEVLKVKRYEKLLERLSGELCRLREKICGTRATTNASAKAKLSAAMIAFELDDDPYLYHGAGSFDAFLRSLHLDMRALDAQNTTMFEAMRAAQIADAA